MNVTPAMQQYYDIKASYPDAILFFRMGDFYEMFESDAQIAHKILWIALTSRNKNSKKPVLLAGIPYHAKEKYLPMLVKSGYKVAIAEQVGDPKLKWIVKRQVVRVVTPATIWLEWESYETSDINPIIASLVTDGEKYGLSLVNLADHSWKCSEFENFPTCVGELSQIAPREIILERHLLWDEKTHEILSKKYGLNIYYYDFLENPYTFLVKKFWTKNLEWYGLEWKKYAQKASAQIVKYIWENQKSDLSFLQNLSYETFSGYMDLDEATIRSLDLVYNISTASSKEGTLFGTLDETKTPMGKRFLKEQILHPLQDIKKIQLRQDFIETLKKDTILLDKIRTQLNFVVDIDAILTRLSLERATPRDLLSLKRSLLAIKEVYGIIQESDNKKLKKLLS